MTSSSTSMRAAVQDAFGPAEVLRVTEVPRPSPLPTEVLVRVHAAGVNTVDWKTRAGGGISGLMGQFPFTLGWDVSGVVEEVGFGVTTLRPGDEVYGMPWFPRPASAYADYVTAPARQFARKPASLTHIEAGGVPLAGLTAYQILVDTAKVSAGTRVLVHAAAGGVGHLAVRIAKSLGAYVIGTASAAKHAQLQEAGVDEAIDYTDVAFESAVKDVDVVVDLIGDEVASTSTRSLEVLRPNGLLVAVPSGVSPELLAAAHERGLRATPFLVEPDGTALAKLAELIDSGSVRVKVDADYLLEDVAEAHRRGELGRTSGKLVLRMV